MIVGLTGGIASGKSAVSSLLAELGAEVTDADEAAREVVKPGRPAFEELVQLLGTSVVLASGTLNRTRLAELIFDDPVARAEVEAVLHPRIYAELANRLGQMDPHRVRVVEAALLVETLSQARRWLQFDVLVVVTCSKAIQLKRLTSRGLTQDEAELRIQAQATPEERARHADYLIRNDGPPEELAPQVAALWDQLSASAG